MRKVAVLFVVAALAVACSQTDPWGNLPPSTNTSASTTTNTDSASCTASIQGQDPTTFPPCTGTKGTSGRCVPTSGLGKFSSVFEQASCSSGQACLPEELIKAGSAIQLKTCTAVLNGEGRCFWPLATQVIANYDLLKSATKDQCEPDQVCAPCVNPLTHATTGVCDVGGGGSCASSDGGSAPASDAGSAGLACPQNDPILDPSAFQQLDCPADMYCVDPSLAGAQASKLGTCSKGVCAPAKSVLRGGMYVPTTCKATAGAEGRCTNVGLPSVAKEVAILPQDVCDADERCAPCFDPRDGSSTGACNQAPCDAPKDPPTTFPTCCDGAAHCVPTSAVPASSQSMLGADSCTGDTPLCAPNELIPMPNSTPKPCSQPLGLLAGICLSKCALPGVTLGALLKGDCDDGQLCAPCSHLPSGTTGCN